MAHCAAIAESESECEFELEFESESESKPVLYLHLYLHLHTYIPVTPLSRAHARPPSPITPLKLSAGSSDEFKIHSGITIEYPGLILTAYSAGHHPLSNV
jgi:hypothetical protein